MIKMKAWSYALAATVLLGSSAYAVDQAPQLSGATRAADKDFGKLSTDGQKAFRLVHMARLAIFQGHANQAKGDVEQARSAMDAAKSDDTVFVKAAAELNPPSGNGIPLVDKAKADKTPIKWLPVDGEMTMSEDYTATPQKTAAVTSANEHIKKGDHKGAMQALKLADVDMSFLTEVAPLDKSAGEIDQAAKLIDAGQYYQANQTLKQVEDGVRFDVTDIDALPQKSNQQAAAGDATSKTMHSTAPAAKPQN